MTLDTSGPQWRQPLAHYVPDTSCSRTWQVMSLWGWTPFSGTLPTWGMTRHGALYELATPELPTVAPDCSSSLPTLLPTPVVNDMGAGKTPEQLDEWTGRMKAAHGNGNGHGPSLSVEAQRLLPTPDVPTGGERIPDDATWTGSTAYRSDGSKVQVHLSAAVEHLLPTPVADNSRGLPSTGTDYASLANSVCSLLPTPRATVLTGARTRARSDGGSSSSDDPPPDLLSLLLEDEGSG